MIVVEGVQSPHETTKYNVCKHTPLSTACTSKRSSTPAASIQSIHFCCWRRWLREGRSRSRGTSATCRSASKAATSTPTRPSWQCGRRCSRRCSAERSGRATRPSSSCPANITTTSSNLSASCTRPTNPSTVSSHYRLYRSNSWSSNELIFRQ